jgi:uncharacterized protein DUF1707
VQGPVRGPVQGGSLRIGDAERDTAVAELSEHFVAGRLTQDEFEERSDQATRARYADEVDQLFADLPDAVPPGRPPRTRKGHHPRARAGGPPPFLWIVPVLMVGLVVSSVILAAPWLLWMLFWIAMISGPVRHGRWQQGGRRG